MRADWIPTTHPPREVGAYLVTTARGKVKIDRWDGEMWSMCNPANRRGRYRLHKAWTYLPPVWKEVEKGPQEIRLSRYLNYTKRSRS